VPAIVDIDANANEAGEHSNQAVGNQNHNITSIVCCNSRTALLLVAAVLVLVLVSIGFGLGFGLPSRSGHNASQATITPSASLTPTQNTPPASEATSVTRVTSSSLSTTAASSTRLPPPSPTADGVHLVDYKNTTAEGSGFAWYRSALQGNHGTQPDDFTPATVGMNTYWEGRNTTGLYHNMKSCFAADLVVAGYFVRSKVTFWASINSTVAAVDELAGVGGNGFRSFLVYKDDDRLLYKANGTEFYSIYYCQ
ncbi:MAG: hypothetical protein LQ352_008090, partial [Teloschistes flavicans]